HTPDVSVTEAEKLAHDHFGISAQATTLESERDRNFRLDIEGEPKWVLKIINASEPEIDSAFQTALLQHLANAQLDIAVPRLKTSKSGDLLVSALTADQQTHSVRLVEWLPGTPLAKAERNFALMRALGSALGRLDQALKGFIHPGALRDIDWDLRHAGRARSRLHFVKDPAKRAILERFLNRFEQNIVPKLPFLRAQVIHNDANDWNVLVNEQDHSQIAGVIDFGDSVHTILIAEVAIACAYSIL